LEFFGLSKREPGKGGAIHPKPTNTQIAVSGEWFLWGSIPRASTRILKNPNQSIHYQKEGGETDEQRKYFPVTTILRKQYEPLEKNVQINFYAVR
jgi:hypothetical protein